MVQQDNSQADQPRELTGEEQALYDRQIRLWGVEAQRRLSAGRILIAGDVTCQLAQELAKNIVLAGVAKITLCDSRPSESSGFLGRSMPELSQSLREMNPLVQVCSAEDPCAAIPDCDVVCSSGLPVEEDRLLSVACRKQGVPFFSGRCAGFVGWVFIDLGDSYEYTDTLKKQGEAANGKSADSEKKTSKQEVTNFSSFADAMDAPWGGEPRRSECGWHAVSCLLEFEKRMNRLPGTNGSDAATMDKLYQQLQKEKKSARGNEALISALAVTAHASLPPVSAIVGGVWGRELVKVLSRRDAPLNNFFFFNARTCAGSLETIKVSGQ